MLSRVVATWIPPNNLKVLNLDFQQDDLDVIIGLRLGGGLEDEIEATCRVRGGWLNKIPFRKLCPHVHLLLNAAVGHVIDPPGSFIPEYLKDRIRPSPREVGFPHDAAQNSD